MSIAFIVSQLLGVRYYDWLAEVVPHHLLVHDYVISYPITYGSEIYKSNGWVALEPSFMSFMIGVCLVSALVTRMSMAKVLVLLAGLLSTVAGSGIAVVPATSSACSSSGGSATCVATRCRPYW